MNKKIEILDTQMKQIFKKGDLLLTDLQNGDPLTTSEKKALDNLDNKLSELESMLTNWLEKNKEMPTSLNA